MSPTSFARFLILSALLLTAVSALHTELDEDTASQLPDTTFHTNIFISENKESIGQTMAREEYNNLRGKEEEKVRSHHIPGAGLSIIFIFGSLLYGAILKVFCRFVSIPYNPLLLISGIILGLYYKNLGMLGDSIDLVSSASPSGVLAIFLPVLIFQASFKTEWHIFKKLAGQSLILGILSTLVSASLIMFMVKLYLDSQNKFYDWGDAFMMGSMLSCTDILSFVNRLKRKSAPQKIIGLLQGESLFNYCTCVLIVELMHYYQGIQQQSAGFWDYLNLFAIEVSGGIIFGVLVGMVAVYCIKRMIYDGILVVTLMVIFTYSIYLLAEFSTMPISGIVSLAIFALYMNAFGKPWLMGQTIQVVDSFWSYLVFVGETNIFMIAGVMVGTTLDHLHINSAQINVYTEMLSSLYIYLFTVVARFFSIAVFIKYLRILGEGLNLKEIVLMTYAGLKGAIGIALAMQIYKSQDLGKITSYLILIHVTSNSIITFLIHGTWIGLIVRMLGLSSLKKVEYKFFKQYLFSFKASLHERLLSIREQAGQDSMINWEDVEKQIGLPTYSTMVEETDSIISTKKFKNQSKIQKSLMFKLESTLKEHNKMQTTDIEEELTEKIAQFDLQVQFRKRFTKDLIAKYWQFHDANETSPAALMLLIQSANYDLDRQAQQIESWGWIKNQISFNMRLFAQLMKVTVINALAKSSFFDYVSFCYDVVSSFIKAHEEVREEISIFYQKSEHTNQDSERLMLENILRESQQNQKQAQFFLTNYLEPSFPQIQQEVKTRKVSFIILNTFKDIIDKNNQNGQLEPNQYDLLNQIINHRSLRLTLGGAKWKNTPFITILTEDKPTNLFKNLPQPVLQLLSSQLSEENTYDSEQKIIDNGEIAKYFFFVKKGGCMVEFTSKKLVYKEPMLAGQVFGFESLVTNIYHSKATTNTMAEIVQVKKSLILKIFQTFPHIQQTFWKSHIFECYKMFHKKNDISYRISQLQKQQVEQLIKSFNLACVAPGILEDPQQDMIFLRGNIEVTSIRDDKSSNMSPNPLKKTISKQKEDPLVCTDTTYPFFVASRLMECSIRVKQSSYFLMGMLDYDIFELEAMRPSRSTAWRGPRKKQTLA